jgi:protein SCO1
MNLWRRTRSSLRAASLLLAAGAFVGLAAHAQQPARVVQEVKWAQKLDEQIELDVPFRDETGAEVQLSRYFEADKPVVLLLVYYECPMLCTEVLNGFVRCLKPLGLEPGTDFEIVTVSISHTETPALAAKKKQAYLDVLGRPAVANGWHFLTGSEDSIRRLADSIGFRFMWDPEIEEYAHAGGLTVLTPAGRISKYFFDVEFPPRDLRLALVEASQGEIGSFTDRVLLLCYHYDPTTGKYGLVITTVIRVLGALTVTLIIGSVLLMLRRDRRKLHAEARA